MSSRLLTSNREKNELSLALRILSRVRRHELKSSYLATYLTRISFSETGFPNERLTIDISLLSAVLFVNLLKGERTKRP